MFKDILTFLKGIFDRFWVLGLSVIIGLYIAKSLGGQSISSAVLPVAGIIGISVVLMLFYYPQLIIFSAVIMGHFIAHLGRIGVTLPVGLSIDALLGIALAILLVDGTKDDFRHIKKPEFIAIFCWVGYTWVEIANPISPGPVAWFYAMRSMSLYYILTPVAVCGLIKTPAQFKSLFYLLIPLSLIMAFNAIKQDIVGMNEYEMRWLMTGPIRTHFIRGKMRVFSFLSDASTFGAYAAYMATLFGVMAAYPKPIKFRWAYAVIALFSFYAMMISGSRGPLAIIGVGGMVYLIMSKRVVIATLGAVAGAGAYVFLAFTKIAHGNYNVARLRSALDPNDPSLLVRKAKEAVLKVYMADKPIGGGIGSAGLWGERFAPGTFLANTPTDGLYSRIWMETGIIGLYLYLGVFIVLVVFMGYRLWFIPESQMRQMAVGMYSAFVGILVASYVNEIVGQVPLSIICYSTPALVMILEHWHQTGVNIDDPPSLPRAPLD